MEWTDERIEMLKELWAQGKSASQCAEILGGTTRNAVIGKAHRLGLAKRPSPIKRDPNAAPARPRRRRPKPQPIQEVHTEGTDIMNLTERMCRWPLGHPGEPGFRFCGAAVEVGETYCAYHASIAYQAPKRDRQDRPDSRRRA